eukprot:TRINITY_DN26501_c0_g1_i1.p1 TRINITY_DN26501_c0_g1~~TRINITY_DN26501_c0_g1_i1.p1  ORF type:complete len:782 (+),score=108.89 TRINITY_DN26501_c0_g1_i1:176-2521(+)
MKAGYHVVPQEVGNATPSSMCDEDPQVPKPVESKGGNSSLCLCRRRHYVMIMAVLMGLFLLVKLQSAQGGTSAGPAKADSQKTHDESSSLTAAPSQSETPTIHTASSNSAASTKITPAPSASIITPTSPAKVAQPDADSEDDLATIHVKTRKFRVRHGSSNICWGPVAVTAAGRNATSWSVVKFQPEVDMELVHHMVLFGGKAGSSSKPTDLGWETCWGSGFDILFSWARTGQINGHAKGFEVPANAAAGFKIGLPGSGATIEYLYLNVHYENRHRAALDSSGFVLGVVPMLPHRLQIAWLHTEDIHLPKGKPKLAVCAHCTAHMDQEGKSVLAFRNHGHTTARDYWSNVYRRINRSSRLKIDVGSFGNKSTQLPQTYYHEADVAPAMYSHDVIKLRCEYDTTNWTKSKYVTFDATDKGGEMCNQYIMGFASVSCSSASCDDIGARFGADKFLGGGEGLVLKVDRTLGQVTGIAVSPASRGGTLWAFHRDGKKFNNQEIISGATVLGGLSSLDSVAQTTSSFPGSSITKELGQAAFIVPHGLAVDAGGRLWITDVGLHQVFQISPDSGSRLLVLGTARQSGSDGKHFNQPTGVAFAVGETHVYVADGYGNSRVAVFELPSGNFLGEWGRHGSRPGEFDTPHSLAVDRLGRIYVADRDNARIQVFAPFDATRKAPPELVAVWPGYHMQSRQEAPKVVFSKPWLYHVSAVTYDVTLDVLFAVEGERVVMRDLRGNVLQHFGRTQSFRMDWPHDVASYTDTKQGFSVVWVAELNGQKVRQFLIK